MVSFGGAVGITVGVTVAVLLIALSSLKYSETTPYSENKYDSGINYTQTPQIIDNYGTKGGKKTLKNKNKYKNQRKTKRQ